MQTRDTLQSRTAEVQALRVQKRELERKLRQSTSDGALAREARRLGLVRPGERLFIVQGIDAWRRAHSRIGSRGGR